MVLQIIGSFVRPGTLGSEQITAAFRRARFDHLGSAAVRDAIKRREEIGALQTIPPLLRGAPQPIHARRGDSSVIIPGRLAAGDLMHPIDQRRSASGGVLQSGVRY